METQTNERQNGIGQPGQIEEPASGKQIGYLKSLGVEIPKDLSKRRASELIDEALAKQQ